MKDRKKQNAEYYKKNKNREEIKLSRLRGELKFKLRKEEKNGK